MIWLDALWRYVVTYWPVVMTVLLPFVVSAIARRSWSGRAKSWLALGLSMLVGVLGGFAAGVQLTPETIGIFTITVYGGVKLAYEVFRSIGITNSWLDDLLALGSVVRRE